MDAVLAGIFEAYRTFDAAVTGKSFDLMTESRKPDPLIRRQSLADALKAAYEKVHGDDGGFGAQTLEDILYQVSVGGVRGYQDADCMKLAEAALNALDMAKEAGNVIGYLTENPALINAQYQAGGGRRQDPS
ncbi:MAG: hypothetical protein J0L97_07590 [Alphaproteobacteria bacterium]|nr:hypothetical protein [Alphaproteobacteria bacterium]